MDFEGLTEDQKARARECMTAEELVSLAKEEGIELSEEQLEEIAGGEWNDVPCPEAHSGLSD